MAETKKATTTKPVKAESITELTATAGELRLKMNDHLKANKSGSSTNVRAITSTRKELARTLTKINQLKKANQE